MVLQQRRTDGVATETYWWCYNRDVLMVLQQRRTDGVATQRY